MAAAFSRANLLLPMNALPQLRAHLGTIHDLSSSAAVLEWDAETYMPDGATALRATQVATLRRLAHEAFASPDTSRLLDEAEREAGKGADAATRALIEVTRRDLEKAMRLPSAFVGRLAEATGLARKAWRDARAASDFSLFAPHLETLVALNRQKAEYRGYADHPYTALLDEYEPGFTLEELRGTFAHLQAHLVPLVAALARRPQPDSACLRGPFGEGEQWAWGLEVLGDIGFDFSRGRLDRSSHPFTTTFGTADVRLTTRIAPDYFPTAFFGTLHEAGHGLYEQGIDPIYSRTPLAEGTSLGMHESQSRLWENLVGRSRGFWQHYFPRLQHRFPAALHGVTPDDFVAALGRVEATPIRVEADEVTYNLHVALRFELEVALVEGSLAVADLPGAWDDGMERLLGIRPASDAEGVLQDVHWALGTMGYFPTYTLGTLMASMLFEAAERDLGPLEARFAAGDFAPLLEWLRRHVHQWGRARSARDILEATTGHALDPAPWLRYVRAKFDRG